MVKKKKLVLNRETIRMITATGLRGVVGGQGTCTGVRTGCPGGASQHPTCDNNGCPTGDSCQCPGTAGCQY